MSRHGPPALLDYEAALARIMGLPDFERSAHRPGHGVFKLDRMALLMERLGNPHLGVATVHIAGSKGKGSTAAMVASMLMAAGYRTGLYTSPHLHSVVERIRVGLQPIERSQFAALVDQVWPGVDWVGEHGGYGPITFFELLTAMAFLHFKQAGADIQVVEVGLGGRLDATNIVSPEVCAITSISLDHVSTLGNTLALIAAEKAGIIKQDIPVVVAPQSQEALGVFLEVAADKGAPMVQVSKGMSWRTGAADLDGQSFEIVGLRGRYQAWTPLLGEHQVENACTAIATVETLTDSGFTISSESIVEGLGRVRWPGRLEVLSKDEGLVVVDSAHSPDSMRRLMEAVQKHFEFERVILIFGATSGHSARGMMRELAVLSPHVVAVRSRHPRSAPIQLITGAAHDMGLEVLLESEDVEHGVRGALSVAGEKDLVLATGSVSVAAEVIEEVRGMTPELYPNLKRPPVSSTV